MQNITWLLVGWNFLCWTRVEHTIRNSISTRSHVLFSIYIPYVNTEQRQFQINLALQFWAPLKFCLLGKKKPEKELDDETSWVKFKCVYHLFIPALLWATGLARIFAVTTILEIYFAILAVVKSVSKSVVSIWCKRNNKILLALLFTVSLILPYMLENLVDYLIPRNLSARSESLLYLTGEDSSLFTSSSLRYYVVIWFRWYENLNLSFLKMPLARVKSVTAGVKFIRKTQDPGLLYLKKSLESRNHGPQTFTFLSVSIPWSVCELSFSNYVA